jgi:hypothetical protein
MNDFPFGHPGNTLFIDAASKACEQRVLEGSTALPAELRTIANG